MILLKKSAVTKIKKHKNWQRILSFAALEMNSSEASVRRWFKNNDVMLTTLGVLKVICQETGMSMAELSDAKTEKK